MWFLIFYNYAVCQIYPSSDNYTVITLDGAAGQIARGPAYTVNSANAFVTKQYPELLNFNSSTPGGTAVDSDGNIFVCDSVKGAIWKINMFGDVIILIT
jgi:sugar lactone lactonase YvrE